MPTQPAPMPDGLDALHDLERSITRADARVTRLGRLAAALATLGYPKQAAFARALLETAEAHFISLHDRQDRLLRGHPPPGWRSSPRGRVLTGTAAWP